MRELIKNALRQWLVDNPRTKGAITCNTELTAVHMDKFGNEIERRTVRDRKVTTAFAYELVDVLKGTSGKFDLYKWHGSGTSTGAESTSSTALGAQTRRDLGTQTEGASSNAYVSVATSTYAATASIVEHGLFNSSSGGTLMDRTLFAVINAASGDKVQWTFTLTITPGG